MKIILLAVLGLSSLAYGREVTAPVSVKLSMLFTAGTSTYLADDYVQGELNRQVAAACGPGAILMNLDIRYVVNQITGTDTSDAELTGTVRCQVSTNPFEVTSTGSGRCADHFGDGGYEDAVQDGLNQAKAKCSGDAVIQLNPWKSESIKRNSSECQTKVAGTFACQ